MLTGVIKDNGNFEYSYGIPDFYVRWEELLELLANSSEEMKKIYTLKGRNVCIGIVGTYIHSNEEYVEPKFELPKLRQLNDVERGKGYYAILH